MISDLVFGGITGLVGGIAQKWADYKTKKLELEMQQKQLENQIALHKIDIEIAKQEAASADFKASFNEPKLYSANVAPTVKQGWLLVFVDFLRGFVRPFLTLYLCGITTVMYWRTDGGSINPQSVVDTVLFLTVTSVCWWFGSRAQQK